MKAVRHALIPAAGALAGLLWIAPLLLLCWGAFHPGGEAMRLSLQAEWGLANFPQAWRVAPFARYLVNTVAIVALLLLCQIVVCTLAGYALARMRFPGRGLVFGLVLVQLMVMPEVLIVENYLTIARLGQVDHYLGVALPYIASAFGIFLLRQTFMTVPQELEDAARVEGLGRLATLLKVYVPLARPTYLAYGLVSVSYHWNNFLWPLVATQTEASRPVTVGMALFAAPETGVDWGVLSAGTLLSVGPLVLAFLLFQRQFMQSFMQAGVK
ncbi:sn-glycerol 3-phosphate transport system permease protein [Cupriavidus gilardii J11]|uniref:sn-glycerol 3-phosphate transport system permease protein n=1 Tax=Cupriavidus gilardii J11 TaxID=936133 RepID=A0A562BFD1_9BURK|nr:carbohydrate ABC transporter permease [Cupriavidus gilardii]TWG83788.1 sn-glycerol 3-phosphate transport system permease protein [Cupriavidus gilardii J11]